MKIMKIESSINKQTIVRNNAFDLLKGIGCIGVVLMHISFPGIVGGVLHKLAEFAVPVFIMISGYFAYGCSCVRIKHRLLRIVRIFILALTIYTVYNIGFLILRHQALIISAQSVFQYAIKLIVFCTVDYAIPLWYLIAMIETYLLWLVIQKYLTPRRLVLLMIILFAIQISSRIVCETYGFPWYVKINFITCALPWFLFGYYMRMPGEKYLNQLDEKTVILIGVIGCVVALIPVFFETPIQFSFLGVAFYALSIFILATRKGNNTTNKALEYIGNKLSLNVYLFHLLIGSMLGIVLRIILSIDTTSHFYMWGLPILTVVTALCFAWMIDQIEERVKKHLIRGKHS